MVYGPINRKPQERTIVRERPVANTAKYIDVNGAGRGFASIAGAFSKFSGKMDAEQEKAEQLKDQKALDQLYLDINANPEAASAASRSGDWSFFSINERMTRPSIAKMMPKVAGQAMGMGILQDAKERIKHLGASDDPEQFLQGYIKSEIEGISDPSIERQVFDIVMKGTSQEVAQHREFMTETFNNRQRNQFRTTATQLITDNADIKSLMGLVDQSASAMAGNLAENRQALREAAISEVLWLSEAGNDAQRDAATAMMAQEMPDGSGRLLDQMDGQKRETILRNARELAKSRDKAKSSDFYNTLWQGLEGAHTYAEKVQVMNAAWSRSVNYGASTDDQEYTRIWKHLNDAYRAELNTSSKSLLDPSNANKLIKESLTKLDSVDPESLMRAYTSAGNQLSKNNQKLLSNIIVGENHAAGLKSLHLLTSLADKNFTYVHNIDLGTMLPEDDSSLPQVAFLLSKDIKSVEDLKTAKEEWAATYKSAFVPGNKVEGSAYRFYNKGLEDSSKVDPVQAYLDDGENRAELYKHFNMNPGNKGLGERMSQATYDYLERRLNMAASGLYNQAGATKDQLNKTARLFMGKPQMVETTKADGSTQQTPTPTPKTGTNKAGERVVGSHTALSSEEYQNVNGSDAGETDLRGDGSSALTTQASNGVESKVVAPVKEAWYLPEGDAGVKLAAGLEAGGYLVTKDEQGRFVGPVLEDAPAGTKINVDKDGTRFIERTAEGWEFRNVRSKVKARDENLPLYGKVGKFIESKWKGFGFSETGEVKPPTPRELIEQAKEKNIFQQIQEANERRGDFARAEAAGNARAEFEEMIESVGGEFDKMEPDPNAPDQLTNDPSAEDKARELKIAREQVSAAVDAGQAHPEALQHVGQYSPEAAINLANKENNFIANANQIAMSTLGTITSTTPSTPWKQQGVAPHIGTSKLSKANNPLGVAGPDGEAAKFDTPTQGIEAANEHFKKRHEAGDKTVRALLGTPTKGGTLVAPIADKHLNSSARAELRAQGKTTISLDTNSIGKPHTFEPMVVIPDDASPEIKKQAEAYVSRVAKLVSEKTGKNFKGRVVTRSENGRGRDNTVHLEPFGVNDTAQIEGMDATAYWSKGPGMKMMAQIMRETFGSSNEAMLTSPHGNGDPGAVGPHGSEVDLAAGILKELGAGGETPSSPQFKEGTPAAFVAKLWQDPALHETAKKLGLKPEFIIAQAALESGWGKHVKGNALFGVKGYGHKGKVQEFETFEYIDGKKVTMKDKFRAYDSWGDSIRDYGEFIAGKYSHAMNKGTGKEYYDALQSKKYKYATAPDYSEVITGILGGEHIQETLRKLTAGADDAPETDVNVVARHMGVSPDEPISLDTPEKQAKFLKGVASARQGTNESRTWMPYIDKVVVEKEPVQPPATGTGDMVTGHGYRMDWPIAETDLLGTGIKDISKITPQQSKLLAATRINYIMSQYAEWIPGVTMSDRRRQALTEYLYTSPWNDTQNLPAFLNMRLQRAIRDGNWDRVAREVERETRVFKRGLNSVQKDAERFLTKKQRQALADRIRG